VSDSRIGFETAKAKRSDKMKIVARGQTQEVKELKEKFNNSFYWMKSILPRSAQVCQAFENPPASAEPLMTTDKKPASIIRAWKTSVQITAFRPPWKAFANFFSVVWTPSINDDSLFDICCIVVSKLWNLPQPIPQLFYLNKRRCCLLSRRNIYSNNLRLCTFLCLVASNAIHILKNP